MGEPVGQLENVGDEPDVEPVAVPEVAGVPIWRRRSALIGLAVLVAAVLVGGSMLTSRGRVGVLGGANQKPAADLKVKAGDPNVLAANGDKLLIVEQPPSQTRVVIRLSKDLGKPVFAVQFEPFGLTSDGGAVIKLTTVTAQGGTPLAEQFAKDFVGQNVKVQVAEDSVSALKNGGSYVGEITLVQRGSESSFAITKVKRN
jgi:hypothetical protein